jgi:pimeloyl-ACP methyl ester carboxylesterase
VLAGGSVAYTTVGSGEPLVLVHGLGDSRRTWNRVMGALAVTHTVIAVDLPGHGESDAPGGDYSLGAHATVIRDLLLALGHTSATIAGHSLGGGVALQFAYQFPQHVDRLLLISSGGLGPELSPLLRAVTLPGTGPVIARVAQAPSPLTHALVSMVSAVPGLLARQDVRPLRRSLPALAGARQREAFLHTARSVIDWRGQTVNTAGRLGLLADIPVLIAWGSDDRTIPPHHHRTLAGELPGARVVEITGAGHFPHETAPDRLLPAVHDFLDDTDPFHYDVARWRQLLTAQARPDDPTAWPTTHESA